MFRANPSPPLPPSRKPSAPACKATPTPCESTSAPVRAVPDSADGVDDRGPHRVPPRLQARQDGVPLLHAAGGEPLGAQGVLEGQPCQPRLHSRLLPLQGRQPRAQRSPDSVRVWRLSRGGGFSTKHVLQELIGRLYLPVSRKSAH
eukprot:5857473-Pyramimonas_sp.AAC.1